jgi:alpha-amylase
MVAICFYFQVHQPYRLNKFSIFDIGKEKSYFDDKKNKEIFDKVSEKCYLETNELLLKLLKKHPEFKIAFSFSGVVLKQMEEYNPKVLDSFKALVNTGRVEIIQETFYHSLAFMFSKKEFFRQVQLHKDIIKRIFNYDPKIFRNTELIYNNELAMTISKMGYKGLILEGVDRILGGRSPNFLYSPVGNKDFKLLLKNYRLSDDIAFRFSNKGWVDFPLSSEKFTSWVNAVNGNGETINLFMDFETFGEHQWKDTGIFQFLEKLPEEILKNPSNSFKTPSEVIDSFPIRDELDIHHFISWADLERDTSAWTGNEMQQAAAKYIYEIEEDVLKTNDEELIDIWGKLQTSDHYYYMCTKWFNDGDVHKYFNPYSSPYDAFINFNNILNDLIQKIEKINKHKINSISKKEYKLPFL